MIVMLLIKANFVKVSQKRSFFLPEGVRWGWGSLQKYLCMDVFAGLQILSLSIIYLFVAHFATHSYTSSLKDAHFFQSGCILFSTFLQKYTQFMNFEHFCLH